MKIGRRRAIVLLGAVPLAGVLGPAVAAGRDAPVARRLYLGANDAGKGAYRFAAVARDGHKVFEVALPGRGHGIAVHPHRAEAVAFARRPGTFALVVGLADGTVKARLESPAGRHFFGHGVFSTDGRTMFTTENDFAAGRGVIGVWDAADGYRRVAELSSHGIGPHELVLAPDGHTLIVANGGLLTHPSSGRRKLNIPTMDPSLAYIDCGSGTLRDEARFADPRHRLLSIRHLAVNPSGTVCIGLQDQGPQGERLPLVAFHRPGSPGLDLSVAPGPVARRMHGYAGSVAMDSSGRVAVVSAPRGGLVTAWDVGRRAFVGAINLPDGCGVAAAGVPGTFRATSGQGGWIRFDVADGRALPIEAPFMNSRHWDNHFVTVSWYD